MDIMKISVEELREIVHQALVKKGYDETEQKVIADVLLYAQLRGNNQGVVKLLGDGFKKNMTFAEPKVVKDTPVSALYDGGYTHAMVVMNEITEVAIQKAKESGIAIVGNFNTSESTGALGFYVEKIAQNGLIGMAFASAPFMTTAPHGSTEALLCTNPMAYGIPADGNPIILDMTTSAMAYYGLIQAKTAGADLPEGVGYDKDGNPTVDPELVMEGALKTFGGHRGSGLAVIVQVLGGALVQAESFNNESDNAGNLVLAINPDILTTKERFVAEVERIKGRIKNARKAEGVEEILLPGERGYREMRNALESGELDIEDNLLAGLRQAAA